MSSLHLISKNIESVINFKFFYKKIYTCKYFQLQDDKIAFSWAMNIICIVLLYDYAEAIKYVHYFHRPNREGDYSSAATK